MAEPELPVGQERPAPEVPGARQRHPRRKRSLKLDKEAVAAFVVRTVEADLTDRQERINARMDRHEKLNGWLPNKDWPWGKCANYWVPIMLINSRRMGATLENSVKSMRPVVAAKAIQKQHADKEDTINSILDYQFFVENDGEEVLDAFCTNFVNDEVAYLYVPWVRESQTIREIRIMPGLEEDADHIPQILMPQSGVMATMFDRLVNATMRDSEGWKWRVDYINDQEVPAMADVEFFDTDDGKLEAYITKNVRTFDGPAIQVPDFEDILFPVRSGNLQPPSGSNPYGATYVHHFCQTHLDSIARRMSDGTFDLLSDKDFDAIKTAGSPAGTGAQEQEPKEAKDTQGGDRVSRPTLGPERQLVVTYGGWDVTGDGLEEQVIFWSVRLSNGVCYVAAMRFLSEVYPGVPLKRPLINQSIFPEPNRIYGRSFIDALEPIQDMSQTSMNQHFDWGTLTNMPFGFYRASSGMKSEPITLEPGIMNPLDDPQRDVHFPQFAQRGETFNINTMSLLQQLSEKLGFSEIAFGRVPTGKASALRTTGTTNALMSQVDVSSERILRRLFHALCGMYQMMHRLNRRYLPDKKQIVMVGMAEQGKDPYMEVESKEIDADANFYFKATMLNTNKQMLASVLQQSLALAASPIALQAGLVTPEELYNLYRDIYKAQDLDPDPYVRKPMGIPPGPKLTAEDVFTAIVEGNMPVGTPAEPPQEHLQKLANMSKAPPTDVFFMAFSEQRKAMFQQWVMGVQQLLMLQVQQQMMMANAAGGGGQEQEGPGGVQSEQNPDTGNNAPVQPGETIDGSIGMMPQ